MIGHPHSWRKVEPGYPAYKQKWRCANCGLDRRPWPFLGLRRPWPPNCQAER